MLNLINEIFKDWNDFIVQSIHLILYWISIIYFLIHEKERKQSYVYVTAIIAIAGVAGMQIVNMLTIKNAVFEKVFLLLPISIFLSYTYVLVSNRHMANKKTWLVLFLYAIIIQSGTGLNYDNSVVRFMENPYGVSNRTCWIAESILADAGEGKPYLLAPVEIASEIREYSSDIAVAYGTNCEFVESNIVAITEMVDLCECNYLVVPWDEYVIQEDSELASIEEAGYRKVCADKGYTIYAKIM